MNQPETIAPRKQWPVALNWVCKIALLGFSLTLYNGKSDVAVENVFVFGLLILIIFSIGVESLLTLYSQKKIADFMAIDIAGAVSSVMLLLTMVFLNQISIVTNYKVNLPQLFLMAFSFSYLVCFVYLLSQKSTN